MRSSAAVASVTSRDERASRLTVGGPADDGHVADPGEEVLELGAEEALDGLDGHAERFDAGLRLGLLPGGC